MRFMEDEDAATALDSVMTKAEFKNSMLIFLILTGVDAELNKRLYALSQLGINTVIYYVSYTPDISGILNLGNQTVIPVHPEDDITKVL